MNLLQFLRNYDRSVTFSYSHSSAAKFIVFISFILISFYRIFFSNVTYYNYCSIFILVANNSLIVLQIYDITLLVIHHYFFILLSHCYLWCSIFIGSLPHSKTSVNNWIKLILINLSASFIPLCIYLTLWLSSWPSDHHPKPPILYFHLVPTS